MGTYVVTTVGVCGLQGDFREHHRRLSQLGVTTEVVRTPDDLKNVDALVIPGGESTTIGKLADRYGLIEPLKARIEDSMPVLGTCAGLIFLSAEVLGGDQHLLGVLDIVVERNAFGRQNESFEISLDVAGYDEPFDAVFIRAPWVHKVGAEVDVLAHVDDHPVMVEQGNIVATAFHPELSDDRRIHERLIEKIMRSI